MGNGLIKVFEKTNYCINPDTVEEILPYEESENKCQLEIHFISGKTRKLNFDKKIDMEFFISTLIRKD